MLSPIEQEHGCGKVTGRSELCSQIAFCVHRCEAGAPGLGARNGSEESLDDASGCANDIRRKSDCTKAGRGVIERNVGSLDCDARDGDTPIRSRVSSNI